MRRLHAFFTESAGTRRSFEAMERTPSIARLGLSVPYEWWPSVPILKEIEAAGFGWVQIPSPPASVLTTPREAGRHAGALAGALETTTLRRVIHAPSSVRAGSRDGDHVLEGLVAYAADVGAEQIVYHAASIPDGRASEAAILAETHSLALVARRAEALGVMIALENLGPVFPGPELLSFTPLVLRTMVNRIGSPAVGICLDIGHANVVAANRHADIQELIRPALDHVVLFHLHDNLGARRGGTPPPELDPLRLDLHLPPGRGTIDWRRLAPLLGLSSHAPVLLEVHPPRPSPAAINEAAVEALFGKPVAV